MKIYKHHFLEKESDVTIISESQSAIREARKSLVDNRKILEKYVKKNDTFLTSFSPIKVTTEF